MAKAKGIVPGMAAEERNTEGRLRSHPAAEPSEEASPFGLRRLELSVQARGDHLLYVSSGYQQDRRPPLVVLLHGAGATSRDIISYLQDSADTARLTLLAPTSQEYTWDVIAGGYGPDVKAIDRALEETFSRYAVDPGRVAVAGFSDGASYALSLGITNGDLFGHVLAFSPGFMTPAAQVGSPRVFVSHGTNDAVLPIERCSRRIVPELERAGYEVRYREFEGGHTVPPRIGREAVKWFAMGQDRDPAL